MDKRYILRLAEDRYDGEIRNRFEEAIERIQDDAVLAEIERRIRDGDLEGAVAAAGVSAAAFDGVRESTRRALEAGGSATVREVALGVDFNAGNPRAARRVDELHTQLIREVTDETRAAIRDEIEAGLERGENPKETARRIRGRWNSQHKRFDGGVIGLTRHQAATVRKARSELASGDPKQLRQDLGRKLRDKRYDRSVLKAINEGKGLTQEQIDRMEAAYRRKWVQHRAETIARDQSLEALTQGQEEAMDQAVERGTVSDDDVIEEWVHSGDRRVRDMHEAVPSMNPGGVRRGEMFKTWDGPLLRPRHRSSPGSTARNTINCRCTKAPRVVRR